MLILKKQGSIICSTSFQTGSHISDELMHKMYYIAYIDARVAHVNTVHG